MSGTERETTKLLHSKHNKKLTVKSDLIWQNQERKRIWENTLKFFHHGVVGVMVGCGRLERKIVLSHMCQSWEESVIVSWKGTVWHDNITATSVLHSVILSQIAERQVNLQKWGSNAAGTVDGMWCLHLATSHLLKMVQLASTFLYSCVLVFYDAFPTEMGVAIINLSS